ncbi:YqfQ family protein [Halobacillus litoralis]|uniref:YqfQ family protein n=1 Tax=Halobacillus litoralis TaxID=45668 RepID=UPI001CD38F8B|nr:YqfQ family protein [Halobacillus litoralis]MCA0970416.1 YqfQ family protein [Halobacillus litoralis]
MFPMGQPPLPPGGSFPGFQQAFAPGLSRSVAPFMNQTAQTGARAFGVPGFSPASFGAPGFSIPGLAGGANVGSQAANAVAGAAKTGGAGWLSHMQTALKAMQSAAPMVQQYGPMMKNIPAMINMMKLMNEPDDDEEVEESTTASKKEESSFNFESSSEVSSPKTAKRQGTSQPRLYI